MATEVAIQPTAQRRSLASFLPILGWLPKYNRSWLRPDFLAGITIVALLVPEGMAYAELAGMPPETSLFFANADTVRMTITNRLAASPDPVEGVLLDLELTNDLDVPSADMLKDLHNDLQAAGVQLLLARVHQAVRDLLDRSGVTGVIGEEHVYSRVLQGVVFHLSKQKVDPKTFLELSGDELKNLQEVVNGMIVNATGDQHAQLEELATQLSIEIDKTTNAKTTTIGNKLRKWLRKK